MPVLSILGLIFITLRLTEVIDWSWLWVLAPFCGAFVIWILFALIALFAFVKPGNNLGGKPR